MPCEKLFKRQQELFGHTCIQSFHLSYCLYPPYSGCHWRGDRADESSKRLVKQKCDKDSEAAEYRTCGERMILDQIKNVGCADAFHLLKSGQLVSFKRGPKSWGRMSGWIIPGATERRELCTRHHGTVGKVKSGEVLIPIFIGCCNRYLLDVAISIMYDISSRHYKQ